MQNKPFFILLIVFTLLNIADVITTQFILPGEANPIYNLTNSLIPIYLLKALIIYIVYKFYKRGIYPSNMNYYVFLSLLIYGSFVLLLAQIININAIINPEVLEAAAQTTTSERTTQYFWFMNLFYLAPILFNMLTFWIYDKSIKKVEINKEYYKKRKWWQI